MVKLLISIIFISSLLYASFDNLKSFKADFKQTLTDDKNKTISYYGEVIADAKKQTARWHYKKPVDKTIYISYFNVTIIEPELEQVIIKRVDLEDGFNFFKMLKEAKQIDKNRFLAIYKNKKFTISVDKNSLLKNIEYLDEFDNKVKIEFKNQKYNIKFNKDSFIPKFPLEYDIIEN